MTTDTTPPLPVVAYLIRGGRAFVDAVARTEDAALRSVLQRKDGSIRVPLCTVDAATSALTASLARAAELERERDALRADAVRLDWLDSQFKVAFTSKSTKPGTPGSVQWITNLGLWGERYITVHAVSLRAAIDAAVAAVPVLPDSDLGHQAGLFGSEHAAAADSSSAGDQ